MSQCLKIDITPHPPMALSLSLLPFRFASTAFPAHHHAPSRSFLSLACSARKPSKDGKPLRARMSDGDLCNEIRVFMAAAGLLEDRVPTMKELSENGRKDLAYIVRRRGYKVVLELLRHSSEKDTHTAEISLGNQDADITCRDEASEDQEWNLDESLENNYMAAVNGSVSTNKIFKPSEPSVSFLHLEATNFIHTGVLDTVVDVSEVESLDEPNEFEVDPIILNSNDDDTASADPRRVPSCSTEHQTDWDDSASDKELGSAEYDMDLDSEVAEMHNQSEIDQLKAMLHEKEMELSLLKEQIEIEKQALLGLQAKANVETCNSQRSVSGKDEELLAAEESLSGLKEVLIDYWENCESVELAGSFNGWDHRVKMDPHPPSMTINPSESRKSVLWSTVLWLYPGVYEIKFVVDGHWRIDCQREIVSSGIFENNILRVDR